MSDEFKDCTLDELEGGIKVWAQIVDRREENMKRLRNELAHEEIQQRKALAIWAKLLAEKERRNG